MIVNPNLGQLGAEQRFCLYDHEKGKDEEKVSPFNPSFNNCIDQLIKMENKIPTSKLKSSSVGKKKPLRGQKINSPFQNREISAVQILQQKAFQSTPVENVGMRELNEKLPIFRTILQSQDQGDLARNFLYYLTHQYYLSFKHMYEQQNIPIMQMQKVFNATFSDSEMLHWGQLHLQNQAPDSCLTLLLISQFFHSHSLNSPLESHEDLFLKLITECCKTLLMIKLVLKYIPDSLACNARQLVQDHLKQQILSLNDYEKILIPGGWINLPEEKIEGHFILYLLERRDLSTFAKIRMNTHDAIELASDATGGPSMIEEEIITAEQIEMFLSDILDLLFPNTLKELNSYQNGGEFLLQTGRQYSEEVSSMPSGLDIGMQRYSFNCCFMACFILYQHLYLDAQNINLKGKSITLPEDIHFAALEFRENFQHFLTYACRNNNNYTH